MANPNEFTAARGYRPISDYAFISDCRSCALVAKDGSIDWMCFQRFDANPVCARLLDQNRGGYFRIAAVGEANVTRRYVPDTNVLETRFETPRGVLVVTDCLPVWDDPNVSDRLVHAPPEYLLVRTVDCESGDVEVELNYYPRSDFGLTTPRFRKDAAGSINSHGGKDSLTLQTDLGELELDETGFGARIRRTLKAGDRHTVALAWEQPHLVTGERLDLADMRVRVERTVDFWQRWASRCEYQGPYRDVVMRSMLVLKGLTYDETGAIIAAATTSLPEEIGGVRNWDYRFSWLRDSGVLLAALGMAGYDSEARDFGNFLLRTTAGRVDEMQILYGIGGERLLPEIDLKTLDGWRGSRPVRIGNAAFDQFQLDTFGELVGVTWRLISDLRLVAEERAADKRQPLPIGPEWKRFVHDIADETVKRWTEPDDGIWESRGGRQHFVFSKLMAWMALDRAALILEHDAEYASDLLRWRAVRDEVREAIETKGYDTSLGTFTQTFGGTSLDATALQLVITRFLAPDDPRARSTVEAVNAQLTANGHVYRYLDRADGLPGGEATFVFCTLWLVTAYAVLGETKKAQDRLDQVLTSANDLGLLAEEIDPANGEIIGNFPQAFSHVGLVQAIVALRDALAAESRERPAAPRPGDLPATP